MDADPLAKYSLSPTELQAVLAAERSGAPFLVVRDGDGQLSVLVIGSDTQMLSLGRRPGLDVSIGWDTEVSGLHAELHGYEGEWTIVDDGLSTNGTFVNGQRVHGRQRLRDGDRLRVGRTVLAYRSSIALPISRTMPAAEQPSVPPLTDIQRRVLIALCRPYRDDTRFATPATNSQIAAEVFLSVDAVKMHLRTLFAKFELSDLPPNEKRVRLAECALQFGAVSRRDLD